MACPNPSVDDMLPSLAVLSRAVLISWVVTLCCMHLACTNKTISPAGSSNAITSQEAVGQSQKVCLDTLYAICELAEDDPCSLDRPEERAQLYSIALQQMGLYDPDQDTFLLMVRVSVPYTAARTMNVITTNDGRRQFKIPALLADDACLIAFHEDYEIERYDPERRALYLAIKRHQVVNFSQCDFVDSICFSEPWVPLERTPRPIR